MGGNPKPSEQHSPPRASHIQQTSPYELQWLGNRGKPVKTKRLIPAERAHAIARKLQGTPGVSVSVL